MKSVNFAAVNSALHANFVSYLEKWLPDGIIDGADYVALNPTRADHNKGSFRINISTGHWADFATDDRGGDPLSLFAYLFKNKSQYEAALDLAHQLGLPVEDNKKEHKKSISKWEVITPVPDGIDMPQPRHKIGKFNAVWKYYDAAGRLLGGAARFDIEYVDKETGEIKQGKDVLPVTYCRNVETGAMQWRNLSFPKPRPIYGLDELEKKPKANVIVVEGEKTADSARKLFPAQVVVTWPGGGKAIKFVDVTPLYGRTIILWPDKDAPGLIAMHDLALMLTDKAEKVRFVINPADAPDGWDLADAEWTPEQAKEYIKNNLADEVERPAPVKEEKPQWKADTAPAPRAISEEKPETWPFRTLGYDRTYYYYMASGTRVVMSLTLAQHNKSHLLGLAPLNFWEREFPSKTGCDWDGAIDCVLRNCERNGFFNSAMIRGRGAWYDEGNVAIHLGDQVLIDGDSFAPHKVESRFIYEAGLTMRADLKSPLKNSEAVRFAKLCEMLPWEKPISARLLAGWCVVAHIGGALSWRPHAWVTGRKGSGKTHVMTHIVRPILGDNCLFVQSESTAAGIRQMLAHDSLPVLFDEAEGEDQFAAQRLQTILGLVRQSSSDTGGSIAKGTPGGKAQTYSVRSCFAFSSINASIIQQSDKSRVTVMEINQDHRQVTFESLLAAEAEILTPDYIKRFYARALENADTIRANAVTYAKAVAAEFGEQRAGDQLGTLLAGAYSLYSTKLVTFEEAQAWVRGQNWDEQREEIRGQNDEDALYGHLMQQKIRVVISGGAEDYPVGLLVDIASGKKSDSDIPLRREKAADYLMRNGFRAEPEILYISNTSTHIGKMLKDTPWANNWNRVLRRLPGAEPTTSAAYFGYKGSEARAVKIPI